MAGSCWWTGCWSSGTWAFNVSDHEIFFSYLIQHIRKPSDSVVFLNKKTTIWLRSCLSTFLSFELFHIIRAPTLHLALFISHKGSKHQGDWENLSRVGNYIHFLWSERFEGT
jgi:hypothetical protein